MSADLDEVRRNVRKAFAMRCINLSKDSLTYLTNYVKELDDAVRQKTITRVIDVIAKEEDAPSEFLNLDALKDIIKRSVQGKTAGEPFILENVGEWKPTAFDRASKKFVPTARLGFSRLLGFEVMRRRFEVVKELLDEAASCQLENSIESLFPKNNVHVCLLGMLVRGVKEELLAEDLTGSVQLDFEDVSAADASIVFASPALFFEGGVYVFEGVHAAGRLRVDRVTLPSLAGHDMVSSTSADKMNADDRLVFLSDVLLDDPRVMKALYKILQGFSVCPPAAFVFCGRFLHAQLAYGYTDAARAAFRHLANLLAEFAVHFTKTHFVLVPSADDPCPVKILPCFSLPPSITELFSAMANVHFASNPCRIHFKGKRIVVCRDDLVEKLCRTSIYVTEQTKEIAEHFCNTIWAQRHLSPLPLHLNPVLPPFDYALGLWPAPDALVVADKFKAFVVGANDHRRLTFNPGFFSLSNFEFHVYYPAADRVEASSLDVD